MTANIPDRFLADDGDLDEPLSRAEVEDLFAPGTVILQSARAYHVDRLMEGPELLGTVESDDSLWVTFEESRQAVEVGNALHHLDTGSWIYEGEPDRIEAEWVACDECGQYRPPGETVGAYIPGYQFCGNGCRDDWIERQQRSHSASSGP